MAELKTQRNEGDVDTFIASVENDLRRRDAGTVNEIMTRLSGEPPAMWGDSIVGFGSYAYQSGGRNQEWFQVGFSPRKQYLALYLSYGFDQDRDLLDRLGPHGTGKACLYIKDLEEVDQGVVEGLITRSLQEFDTAPT